MGGKDPLEEFMESHPIILVWRIPWTEELGARVHRVAELNMTEVTEHACMCL